MRDVLIDVFAYGLAIIFVVLPFLKAYGMRNR